MCVLSQSTLTLGKLSLESTSDSYGFTLYTTNYLPPDAIYMECVREIDHYFYGVFYRFTDGVLYDALNGMAKKLAGTKAEFKLLIDAGTITTDEVSWIDSLVANGEHVEVKVWMKGDEEGRFNKLHPKFTVCNERFAAVGSANWSEEESSNNMEIMAKISNETLVADVRSKFFKLWDDTEHAVPFKSKHFI